MERCRTVISAAVVKSRDMVRVKRKAGGTGGGRKGGGGTLERAES